MAWDKHPISSAVDRQPPMVDDALQFYYELIHVPAISHFGRAQWRGDSHTLLCSSTDRRTGFEPHGNTIAWPKPYSHTGKLSPSRNWFHPLNFPEDQPRDEIWCKYRINKIPVRPQCNRNKKQFIELSLKSLVQIWVTFPLPTILIFYNNTIRGSHSDHPICTPSTPIICCL